MCGICGIIDFHQKLSSNKVEIVKRMNEALTHRGPDEEGNFQDSVCTLAMRRLSIIDVKEGQQPQYNSSKNILVFQNGEIYNFKELKALLLKRGFSFRNNSDTEVLAHLYEAEGEKMFALLKGMFAICIYDLKNKKALLARDRFGEKPLYYHWENQVLTYSSEIKSLLCNTQIERQVNPEALPYYFRTSLVPEPLTLLKGVQTVMPGHFIKIDANGLEEQKYYNLTYKVNADLKSDQEAIEFIRPHLLQSVERQTISDVPIGAFLSGGIDSSTIVALLQKKANKPIQTFNVRFEDQEYDESPIARKVAEFCGTDHHEIVVPNNDFSETIFWNIIDHVGLPFRDSSAIPSYFVSEAISKHVKVALSGDGGDELFGGYSLFQWYQKINAFKKIPEPLRQAGNVGLAISQKLPGFNKVSQLRKVKRAFQTSMQSDLDIPIALNSFFTESEIEELLAKEANDKPAYERLKAYPPESKDWTPLRKIMYYRTIHTLPANMLIKIDRMSMANSLEVRAPFLDPDLFNAAAQLPDDFLIRNGKGKWLIREIMKNELPREVFNHPKKGFSIPLYKYQNETFKKLARQLLFEENPFKEWWSKDYLEEIYHQGISHKKSNAQRSVFQSAHRLWMFMQLIGWAKRFEVEV